MGRIPISTAADADSGVVSLTTPHGTTSFPSVLFEADAGNFSTSHEQLELAGTWNKLDYLGACSWLQTSNSLPRDEYHVATSAANLGYAAQWNHAAPRHHPLRRGRHGRAQYLGLLSCGRRRYREGPEHLYERGNSITRLRPASTTRFLYGLTRKREQYNQWQPSGEYIVYDSYGDAAYFGNPVTITGANGYSATGQAMLDFSPTSADQITQQSR